MGGEIGGGREGGRGGGRVSYDYGHTNAASPA